MLGTKVYSPTQASLGAFLGGPIASAYFIKQNFSALNDEESVKNTNKYGSFIIAFLFVILAFLPENLPNMVIPIMTIISTRILVEKYQFKKEDILKSTELDFHSNWRVFFVGLISLVVFIVIGVTLLVVFDLVGITSDI